MSSNLRGGSLDLQFAHYLRGICGSLKSFHEIQAIERTSFFAPFTHYTCFLYPCVAEIK